MFTKTTTPNQNKSELKQMLPGIQLYPSITIITNKQQLAFIQECIKHSMQTRPLVNNIMDEWDSPLAETLSDMIEDTLDSTDPQDFIHGFVL